MPELPEVETVKRTLKRLIVGKTVEDVDVFLPKIVKEPPDVDLFVERLRGRKVTGLGRRGKFLKIFFDPWVLVSHMRMEGRYRLLPREEPLEKHTHVVFRFTDGTDLRYRDVRQFGTLPAELPDGRFVRPTLVLDPPRHLRVVTEEQFGPVVPLIPFDTEEEAVAAADDTWGGLCASVWSADPARVRRAWETLLARHAILRASFHQRGSGEAVQVIARDVELPWREADVSGLPEDEAIAETERLAAEDRTKRFDVATAPLLRLLLVKFAEDRYRLVFTSHHILLDGWSGGLLVTSLLEFYTDPDAEHAADETTHAIVRRANSTFVTPFDREDIYALASALDDVMDMMDEAVDLVLLYEVTSLPPETTQQVEVLQRCAELTAAAMPQLESMGSLDEYWIEINRLENTGDKSYRRILANLFSGEHEALEVLKLKDIVESLEGAIDAFEKVANIVEQIAVKES